MRYIIVVAVLLLVLAGLPVVAQQSKPAAVPPRELTNSIGMKFVRIDPGSFKMGLDRDDADEKPVHDVTLSKGFYLQATEVTQAQWQAVMGSNPSKFKGPDLPVEMVSWEDVQKFLGKLNAREKDSVYRLPTEAEWEYACRAGGQEPDVAPNLGEVAWWGANSGEKTHPVGQKEPNAWGLYDMRGNVWEWVQDRHGPYSAERQLDPQGPPSGGSRVLRGGSWFSVLTDNFRCALRNYYKPDYRLNGYGFRCAMTSVAQQSKPAAVPPRESTNFVAIPPGEFLMGCSPGDSECEDDQNPPHRVRITKGFELGKYEVTQAQWKEVMGSNPSKFKGADRPVEMVSWDDVRGFLAKLNGRSDGYRYRLPTEAEWEYACRAGTTTKYYFGRAETVKDSPHAWWAGNSGGWTHPVGQKKPNGWGLYDMAGNVAEWCQDWFGAYPSGAVTDPRGPPTGSNRVVRDGGWEDDGSSFPSAFRGSLFPTYRMDSIGFRLARSQSGPP